VERTSGDRVIDKSWIWDRNADFRARVLTKKLAKSANKAALFADLASFFVSTGSHSYVVGSSKFSGALQEIQG
jgi:hypothetical protein